MDVRDQRWCCSAAPNGHRRTVEIWLNPRWLTPAFPRRGLNVAQMPGLHPEGTAALARDGAEPRTWGKPKPGLRREALTTILKCAVENQKFAAVR